MEEENSGDEEVSYAEGDEEKEGMFLGMDKLRAGIIKALLVFGPALFLSLFYQPAMSEAKSSVACRVEGSMLVVYGKGAMPRKLPCRNKKSIRKIVVKEGVTSLPVRAFAEYKGVKELKLARSVTRIGDGAFPCSRALKKVTMPGKIRVIRPESGHSWNELVWDYGARIRDITFNSPLSLNTLSYVYSYNLNVCKNDPKYRSIDGMVYSRDGKSLIRIPGDRATAEIHEGCEEFCLSAVRNVGGDHTDPRTRRLKKLVLPASIRRIDENKYGGCNNYTYVRNKVKVVVHTDQLGSMDIIRLLDGFYQSASNILKQFPYVSDMGKIYVNTRDQCLVAYLGEDTHVVIPEGVRKIGKGAFAGEAIEQVTIPGSVTELDDEAFLLCGRLKEVEFPASLKKIGKRVFKMNYSLVRVVLPEGITEIPEESFYDCTALKEVVLPDSVTKIGRLAFASTSVPASIIDKPSLQTIGDMAFVALERGWKQLVLPANIRKVGARAFAINEIEEVRINCPGASLASDMVEDGPSSLTRYYAPEIPVQEWQSYLDVGEDGLLTRGRIRLAIDWEKVQNADGYQIQVSSTRGFGNRKTVNVGKEKRSCRITVKSKNGDYYVRIRPWKRINGVQVYGKWTMQSGWYWGWYWI